MDTCTPQQPCERCADFEEQVCKDIDTVLAYDSFAALINQWTDACLDENRAAAGPGEIARVLRLGTLGQRLLYRAHQLGMESMLRMAKERNQ